MVQTQSQRSQLTVWHLFDMHIHGRIEMDNLYQEITCACLHVRRTDRQLSQMYDRYLRPLGIRSTQYGMLRCVEGLPDPFISDIGRFLSMDQTTVTRNVEKLEKAGLVLTSHHPDDPRKKKVELSAAGKVMLARAHPLWEAAQTHIKSRMGDDDFNNLLRLLDKLTRAAKV